jgi:ATP-dependent Clp protease ATP-binding subunit ClpC
MTEKSNKSQTPVLDKFSTDLTKLAEENALDPIIGRNKEIQRISQILSRRKKNNPVLIGEPGVGKSAIAEGLAIRIINRNVPIKLYDNRVVTLDMGSLVAGTKYRGQFEERIKSLLDEIKKLDNIILFVDEIHTMVGAGGSSGSLDAANMLKPSLARGDIQVIGATTLDEYRKHIETDGALERRFQKVIVSPTTVDETHDILKNIKSRYENHHNVSYTDEAIEACVKLTNRYITDRALPDKAIDALDEAGSRTQISFEVPKSMLKIEEKIDKAKENKKQAVKKQDFEKAAEYRDNEKNLIEELEIEKEKWDKEISKNKKLVTKEDVAEVVSLMSGVPVSNVETEEGSKLILLKDKVDKLIIGQNEAVEKVVKSIHRNRAGLKNPNRPIGSFVFLGPTGVGKTQLAKILAKELFDSEDNLIRIDMSEYGEKFSASRMIGSPPGYVGYEEGGQLTEKVRRKPYSIVLFDEVEKAHPDIFNSLLQILDEGHITDSLGRKIDFKNTIIIMTSNLGVKQLKEFGGGVGFQTKNKVETQNEYNKNVIKKALNNHFRPEFLNRIDDIVIFNSLNKKDLIKIVDIELKELKDRIKENSYELKISKKAMEFLAEKGYDPQYGARPLNRSIQKYIEDPISEIIIKGEISEGDSIRISFKDKDEELTIKVGYNKEKISS